MVVRNRIKEVGTVLAAKDQEVETKSLNHENGVDEETLASFLSHLEKINSGVERIVQNNEKIRETQKHFFNEFSTSGRERYQDEHKNLMKENKRLGSWLQNKLKEEEEKAATGADPNKNSVKEVLELHIKTVQLSAIKKYLMDIWSDFNTLEVKFRERMKTELIKSILITDGKLCEEEIEAKLEEGDLTALPNSILQETSGFVEEMPSECKKKKFGLKMFSSKSEKGQDPAMAAKQLESLEKRHDDMMRMEQEILEIHGVFMDLATLVSLKGDELNRMEDHVNALIIRMDVTKEKIETVQAEKKVREKRRRKFILLALLVLLLVFIVVGASSGGEDVRDCKLEEDLLDPGECVCDHFLCGDQLTCLPPSKLCDGVADCPLSETSEGGEDEEGSACWEDGSGEQP